MIFESSAKKIFRSIKEKFDFLNSDNATLPLYKLRYKTPFSNKNVLSDKELSEHYKVLEQIGIRTLPYPFGQALAILNDCDWTLRKDYESYRNLFVNRFGLDFADSFKLHQNTDDRSNGQGEDQKCSLECSAVFSYQHTIDEGEGIWNPDYQSSHFEVIREYSLGNLDHIHGFSGFGPRIIWLNNFKLIDSKKVIVRVPGLIEHEVQKPANFCAFNVPVIIVGIVFAGKTDINPVVKAKLNDGGYAVYKSTQDKPKVCGPFPGGYWHIRLHFSQNNEKKYAPYLKQIKSIELQFENEIKKEEIIKVFLLNVDRSAILEMLSTCYEKLNIKTNLFTDHGSKVFLNHVSEGRHDGFNASRFDTLPLPAHYASMKGKIGSYSCLGDDPDSTVYVLPEFREKFNIRFINPSGTSGESVSGFNPLNILSPSVGRDGTTIYSARRTRVPLFDSDGSSHADDRLDHGTRTFPLRLDSILQSKNEQPTVWPFYTHLGNVRPKRERPVPYFPDDVLGKLQDKVFNLTGTVSTSERFWFTQGTVLYDYSLMLRSLPGHVERKEDNIIYIEQWHDPILNKMLPITADQLHGVTFYVKDNTKARIYIDKKEIINLSRNSADESGRQSVTVLGIGPCHNVIDDVDYISQTDYEIQGHVYYSWLEGSGDAFRGKSHFKLTLGNSGTGLLAWKPRGLSPAGSQYFGYAVRKSSENIRFGVFIHTRTGGLFYFGEEIKWPEDRKPTAHYLFAPLPCTSWQMLWAPFYDMKWKKCCLPGNSVPSHDINEIVFFVDGREGEYVEIDSMTFMRPSTTGLSVKFGHILGGKVAVTGSVKKIIAEYKTVDGLDQRKEVVPDFLGYFAFTGIPEGSIVCVRAEVDGKTFFPIQGKCIDLWADNFSLVIR